MAPPFQAVFERPKPIIGMIHLHGNSLRERLDRALQELRIYDEEGVAGAIIEDYYPHATSEDIRAVLEASHGQYDLVRGVNLLRTRQEGLDAFALADRYGARFIQLDSIQVPHIEPSLHELRRRAFPNISVLGGVGFKYTRPTPPQELPQELGVGRTRCEAIVTTGEGTGVETPLDKLRRYKELLGTFPLIVGAGVTAENIRMQFVYADGAIVGSYFKEDGDANSGSGVSRERVRRLMDLVREM